MLIRRKGLGHRKRKRKYLFRPYLRQTLSDLHVRQTKTEIMILGLFRNIHFALYQRKRELSMYATCDVPLIYSRRNLVNAKVSARQQCVYEGP